MCGGGLRGFKRSRYVEGIFFFGGGGEGTWRVVGRALKFWGGGERERGGEREWGLGERINAR